MVMFSTRIFKNLDLGIVAFKMQGYRARIINEYSKMSGKSRKINVRIIFTGDAVS